MNSLLVQIEKGVRPFVRRQVTRRDSPDLGAAINPEWGLPDPSHVGSALLLAATAWLGLWGISSRRRFYIRRATLAADYLLRAQRPSGLIDFKSCNFDSAPDTAFVVQLAAAVIEHAHGQPSTAPMCAALETFVRRAVPGLCAGGFHTPNHRWVIASAIAQARSLFAELDIEAPLASYLNEGIDQDAAGAYQERSPAVYDAVTARSLWLLARHAKWREAMPAIHRNLRLNIDLLHSDGTIETGLSRRQDRRWRVVPTSLAHAYWLADRPDVADWLWTRSATPLLADCFWLAYAQRLKPRPSGNRQVHPWCLPTLNRAYPELGLWRTRAVNNSATFFRNSTRLAHLVMGEIEIVGLCISQSYFGVGQFFAEELEVRGHNASLRSSGLRRSHRPGYDMPLGRSVPIDVWDDMAAERLHRSVPSCASELRVAAQKDGFAFHYRTLSGFDGVPAQVAIDIAPGITCRTDEGRTRMLRAGDVVFLGAGSFCELRRGGTTLRLGPGASAHRTRAMRDVEPAPDAARLLIPLITPVDFRFSLREWRI